MDKPLAERTQLVVTPQSEALGRVYATAQHIWGSDEAAQRFLTTEHPLLQGQKPLEASLTVEGAKRVEEILWRIFYGLPA